MRISDFDSKIMRLTGVISFPFKTDKRVSFNVKFNEKHLFSHNLFKTLMLLYNYPHIFPRFQ
jgi:hypothetical protein